MEPASLDFTVLTAGAAAIASLGAAAVVTMGQTTILPRFAKAGVRWVRSIIG